MESQERMVGSLTWGLCIEIKPFSVELNVCQAVPKTT